MFKTTVVNSMGAIVLLAAVGVHAEEHVIQGVVTQWRPLVTIAQPGDTIRFKTMIGHDTQSIDGMIPAGAAPWQSKLGEEDFVATVDKEGAWIFKCNPHMTTGMVGVVVVGDARPPSNRAALEAALPNVKVGKNMVKRALKKMDEALAAGPSAQ